MVNINCGVGWVYYPVRLVCSKPELCILYAWYQFSGGNLKQRSEVLQVAELILNPTTEMSLDPHEIRNRTPKPHGMQGQDSCYPSLFGFLQWLYTGDNSAC